VGSANKKLSERSEGATLGDELEQLKKLYPNKSGVRIRSKGESASRKTKFATLHLLIEADGEYELHATLFEKREAKSNTWWSQYFAKKVFTGIGGKSATPAKRLGVLEGAILPGLRRSTRLHWECKMVIGYHLHDRR
jgi:hypothetical protein